VAKADTQTVAKLLREYAQRTALRGGNPYRSKAYSRAADSLAALAVPLERLIAEGRRASAGPSLTSSPSFIGPAPIRASKLRKEIPAGVLELLTAPGLRPEKVLRLYRDLASPRSPNWKLRPRTTASRRRRGRCGAADQGQADSCDREGRDGTAAHAPRRRGGHRPQTLRRRSPPFDNISMGFVRLRKSRECGSRPTGCAKAAAWWPPRRRTSTAPSACPSRTETSGGAARSSALKGKLPKPPPT